MILQPKLHTLVPAALGFCSSILPLKAVGLAGGGTLSPGQNIYLDRASPMINLSTATLDHVGGQVESIGDSSGRLQDI